MCVACLNASTTSCGHRWYKLVRPCGPNANLANCRERIQLQGWESRVDDCPWCDPTTDDDDLHEATHRLFGRRPSSSACGASDQESISASPILRPVLPPRRRRSSNGSFNTAPVLARFNSAISEAELDRAQRHRDMNDRLNLYLTSLPHEVLPSARKYYPDTVVPARDRDRDESPPSEAGTGRRTSFISSNRAKRWSRIFLKV